MSSVGVLAVLAGGTTAFGIRHVDQRTDAAEDTPPCATFTRLFDTCALPPPEMWATQHNGGDGGSGGGLANPDGASATDVRPAGGGGGGGGVGFIVVIARTARNLTGLVSPAPTMP